MNCCGWVVILGSASGNLLRMGSLGKQSWVCKYLGQGNDGQGALIGVEWATSHVQYHADCFG